MLEDSRRQQWGITISNIDVSLAFEQDGVPFRSWGFFDFQLHLGITL
jgi:hypothetical protein